MPLINFPSVPIAPGVPDLRRSAIGIVSRVSPGLLGAITRYDTFGLLDGLLGPKWGIYDKTGKPILDVDSVVMFDYRGEHHISNYPVEMGSFSSYNKVARPYDIRMAVACTGYGKQKRDRFLQQLDLLQQTTELYDIATPDATYTNVNLTRYDYRRTSREGVTLLLVDLQWQEVRVMTNAVYKETAKPSGMLGKVMGTVKAIEARVNGAIGSVQGGIASALSPISSAAGGLIGSAQSTLGGALSSFDTTASGIIDSAQNQAIQSVRGAVAKLGFT